MGEVSRTIYRGAATIGSFRCRPSDPRFRNSGPTRGHLLVYPREPVIIRHAGRAAVVADPAITMIYNRDQEYTREALSSSGDRCEWFGFDAAAILEARRAYCRWDNVDRPFGDLTHVSSDARSYLLARRAFLHAGSATVDGDWVDEVCATLLDRAMRHAHAAPALVPTAAHRDLARAARSLIARHYAAPWSLAQIAATLDTSPFHLARVFRAVTGHTIHAFRTQLRLRAALEPIADGQPLAALALELGFSSHSHFTQAFRATFGIPPSKFSTAAIPAPRAR